jgi:hypothetical protein
MENGCLGISGWLFGHKLEPVFNTESKSAIDPSIVQAIMTSIQESYAPIDGSVETNPFAEVFETMNETKRTYIHHICVRCGKTTKENG